MKYYIFKNFMCIRMQVFHLHTHTQLNESCDMTFQVKLNF